MPKPKPRVLIVGGGVIGLSIAYLLSKHGWAPTLLEREQIGSRSSWAGAGMLNCCPWPRQQDPDYHDLMLASIKLHEQWSIELSSRFGLDVGFIRSGALELFTPERTMQIDRMLEGCHARSVPARRIDAETAQRLESSADLTAYSDFIHLPDDAQVRNPWLTRALGKAAELLGATVREGTIVSEVAIEHGKAVGVRLSDGSSLPGEIVIVSAGAWSSQLETITQYVPKAGLIEPIHGQLRCYRLPKPPIRNILICGHNYLVPRGDGILLAGSTTDKLGYYRGTTEKGQTDLKAFAESLLPELRRVEPLQCWGDVRPGLKGDHPLIGPVPGVQHLYLATGHFRNGVCLAPITATIIHALLEGKLPPLSIAPWLPEAAQ